MPSGITLSALFNAKRLSGGQSHLKGSPSSICIYSPTKSIFCVTKKSLGIFRWSLSSDFSTLISTQFYAFTTKQKYPGFQSVSVSSDGKFLVAGGIDNLIHVWDLISGKYLRALRHHRGPITGLAFRQGQNETPAPQDLYSVSTDRSIKVWQFASKADSSEDEFTLAYVDTLFGHLESPMDLSVLSKERCISVGGRDRSARLWKISDSTHLVFNAPLEYGSLDHICMLTESAFVTGSDNGDLTLWNTSKKRPCFSIKLSNKICSLASLKHSSLFACGDSSGSVKVWRVLDNFNSFEEISSIQICSEGLVSSISWIYPNSIFSISNKKEASKALSKCAIVAALSRENRLGRWEVATALPFSSQGVYVVGFSLENLEPEPFSAYEEMNSLSEEKTDDSQSGSSFSETDTADDDTLPKEEFESSGSDDELTNNSSSEAEKNKTTSETNLLSLSEENLENDILSCDST